jgi:hypothetical protein
MAKNVLVYRKNFSNLGPNAKMAKTLAFYYIIVGSSFILHIIHSVLCISFFSSIDPMVFL